MNGESLPRLIAIRDSVLAVTERKFQEVTDRGFNFDYVEEELRSYVNRFFEPFFAEPWTELEHESCDWIGSGR